MKKILWLLLPIVVATASACRKGEPLDNLAPETTLFVSSINLTGPDRLSSEVTMYWSGTDEDGYVKGYEISFDNQNWTFTTRQDSTFHFDLASGTDTLDVNLWVRAIDNDDERDASPAFLKVPVKNTPPTVAFDSTIVMQDTAMIVFSAIWKAEDEDGDNTLDSLMIRINNGNWYFLSPQVNFVTIVPTDPTLSGAVNARVYRDADPVLLGATIDGLQLEGDNQLFIRVRDIAGSWSATDSTKVFFVKKKRGDMLVLDSHAGVTAPTPEDVYLPILNSVAGNYDLLDLNVNNHANIPPLVEPAFGMMMNQYEKVFWYTDDIEVNGQHPLEMGAAAIEKYLNQGGKILISTRFLSTFDPASTVFGFSPMDSLSSSAGQARLPLDSLVIPYGSLITDTLESSAFITGADPFYPKDSANILFTADILRVGNWSGPTVVGARTTNAGNTNQVFISLELHNLNGRPAGLQHFFDKILNDAFNW